MAKKAKLRDNDAALQDLLPAYEAGIMQSPLPYKARMQPLLCVLAPMAKMELPSFLHLQSPMVVKLPHL